MAKMIYTVAEMIADLNWTMEEVDEAIRTSKSLSQIKDFSDAAKRALVEWDDYHDKMQLCRTAWADFLATDRTGRDAVDFDVSVLENMEKVTWNGDADYLARTGVIVKPGFFRRGDRIVVRDGDTYIGRKGGDVRMKPRTIRIVELAAERHGTVRARVVVEEALADMTEKEQAIALASSDDTAVTFTVRGREFVATPEDDDLRYWRVWELVGGRADFFSRELLQPGISRSTALEALERYTRTNITYAEVIAAETAAA